MKRITTLLWVLLALASVAHGAMTYSASDLVGSNRKYIGSSNTSLNPLYAFCNNVEGLLEGTTTFSNKLDTDSYWQFAEMVAPSTPAANHGLLYVADDTGTTKLYFKDAAGTATDLLAAGAGGTLDQAYDQGGAGAGKAITVDTGAIALSNTDADTAWLLTLNAAPSGSAALGGLQITAGANSTQDALEFANAGTGYDIYGTSGTWTVSKAGAGSFAALTGAGTISLNDSATTSTTSIGGGTTTGAVSIGTGASAQTVDVGTGAGAKTVTVGSTNTTSTTNINSGSGAVNVNLNNNQATNIGTGTTTGAITIGGAGAQTISVGNGAAVKTVNLGSGTGASTTTILGGSGGVNINASNNGPTNIGTGSTTSQVTIGGGSNRVDIASDSIDITNGAISGATGLVVAGTTSLNDSASTNTTSIGGGTTTGSVSIGTGASAQAVDVGTGGGAKTVTLGSTNTTSTTAIKSGSGAVTINGSNNQNVNINTGTSTGATAIGNTLGGGITLASGAADITATATGKSIGLTATEEASDAITLTANTGAGGIQIAAGTGDLAISSVDDVSLNGGSAGSLINIGTNTQGNVFHIGDNDTTADTGTIGSAKDTWALAGISVTVGSTGTTSTTALQSGSGGVGINVSNNQPTNINTGTSTGATGIGNSLAGGVTLAAGTADITATATGKSITLTATEEAADAIKLVGATGAGGVTIQSGSAGILVTNAGAMKIGDGGATNYAQFAANTGALTFLGSARPTKTKYLPAQAFTPIAGSPVLTTEIGANKAIGFAFDDAAEEGVATTFVVPDDWAAATDVTLNIYWAASSAEGATKAVVWDVNTLPLASDEDMSGGTLIVDTATDTLISGTAWDLNVSQSITIAASTEWAAGDMVSLILFRDGDNTSDDVTGDAVVLGVKLTYTSDKP